MSRVRAAEISVLVTAVGVQRMKVYSDREGHEMIRKEEQVLGVVCEVAKWIKISNFRWYEHTYGDRYEDRLLNKVFMK